MAARHQIGIVYSHYFTNYYRSRSFYLMLILILLISSIMSYLSFRYSNSLPPFLSGVNINSLPSGEKLRIFSFLWSFLLVDIPVFAAVFFGSPAISSEIESKTALHIFSLPTGRYTLLSGKYLAALSVTLIVVSIYIAFEAAVLGIIFHSLPSMLFYKSYAMLALFSLSLVSLTFLVSSLFSKNLYAYITVFVLYFLVFNAVNFVLLLLYNYNAFFLLSNAAEIIQKVFVNESFGGISGSGSLSPAGTTEILRSSIVMVIYTVGAYVAALLIFERKEVK